MVSKAAVVALVLIVACPVLLGYGMNLDTTTHTDYEITNNPLDVTRLLENGDYYNETYADIYKLNTSFITTTTHQYPVMPIYQNATGASSSLPFELYTMNYSGGYWSLANTNQVCMLFNYYFSSGSVTMDIRNSSNTVLQSISHITYYFYDKTSTTLYYSYYNSNGTAVLDGTYTDNNIANFYFTLTGFATVSGYWGRQLDPVSSNTKFVDFSAGFKVHKGQSTIDLPDYTSSYIVTINLDTMANSTNWLRFRSGNISTFTINKVTTNGQIEYYFTDQDGNRTYLYYDPNRNDNTYQLYFEITNNGLGDDNYYHYTFHNELRYVGSWPTLIGEAPYYQKYECDFQSTASLAFYGFRWLEITHSSDYSPTMRMDSALFTGMMFKTINENTYDPAAFKENPSTTITNIRMYGSSLTFGGTTYNVTDGNITLGTHDYSVRNLVFDSVPVAAGYENRINGIVISTTAAPSTLKFGGQWSAQVITDSIELTTYTSTDWTPGEFAWDGIDTNFLIVALFTTLCVFIGVGVYMRRSKAAILPLLIVCGCAVGLFIAMI